MSTSVTPTIHDRASLDTSSFYRFFELGGRILLASLFLLSGLTKLSGYGATAGYMAAMGVSPALLPLVIATELLGSLAIIVGWHTRLAAFLLAGFTLIAGGIFHNNFGDQIQTIMFLKDIAIAGAFLMLVANGAGPLSVDRRRALSAAGPR